MKDLRVFCVTNFDCDENDSVTFRKTHEDELALTFKSSYLDTMYLVNEDIQRLSDYLLEVHGVSPKSIKNPSKKPSEPYVQGDWIVDINYHTNTGTHIKTYRLDEEYIEEEAVREAYVMFIAELGVEYSNSLLASSDIVIVNAGQLPTPSYRTITTN